MINHNSLIYWYPEVSKLFKTPATKYLYLPNMVKWLDQGLSNETIKKIDAFLQHQYPIFLRTDLTSAKHNYDESCIVNNEKELAKKIYNTLDFNFSVDLYPEYLVFRQYLDVYSTFKAFNSLPIGRELRFFINDGKVECIHRYWVKEVFTTDRWAIRTIPKNWEELWDDLYNIPQSELIRLKGEIESNFPSSLKNLSWSMDFAYARPYSIKEDYAYHWYLIDMGIAEDSYHSSHNKDILVVDEK